MKKYDKVIFNLSNWYINDYPSNFNLKYCEHEIIGNFLFSEDLIFNKDFFSDNEIIKKEDAIKILSLLYEYHLRKEEIVLFSSEEDAKQYRINNAFNYSVFSVCEFIKKFPKDMIEKQDRILMNIYYHNNTPGMYIEPELIVDCSWKTYSVDDYEQAFLLECMVKKELIKFRIDRSNDGNPRFFYPLMIKEKGWFEIEKKIESQHSKNVFVAMWFDPSICFVRAVISKAVKNMNFEPIIIDEKEHNNEISSEILYEIKRSRFLIADVTGQRHGVYFEAGYAMGIGIPVIWTCREDDFKNVHFDTRQYNHIVWKDENDLAINLENRIKGTILL